MRRVLGRGAVGRVVSRGAASIKKTGAWAARRGAALALTGALLVIPFGSYGALQKRIVDGSLTRTVSQGRFIVNEIDDAGTVSWRVSAGKRTPPAVPAIYLLGGSSMRECLPTPGSLNKALAVRQDTRTTVRMLASSNQAYAQNLAIVDNLPAAKGGIIVIAVHHAQFKVPRADALAQLKGVDLLMTSPALKSFLEARLGKKLSNNLRQGLEDHLTAYKAVRGAEPFRGRAVSYRLHRYTVDDRWRDISKKNWLRTWLREYGKPGGAFDDYFNFNAACLTETVRAARAKGYEVALMRTPENTFIIRGALDRYKAKYMALVDTLVADEGAHFVDPNTTAGLVNADFRDLYHLIGQGRTKWQRALADGLAPILVDHYPADASSSPTGSPTGGSPTSPAPSDPPSVGLLDQIRAALSGAED